VTNGVPDESRNLVSTERRRLLLGILAAGAVACTRNDPDAKSPVAAGDRSPSVAAAPRAVAVDAPDLLASAVLLPGLVNSSTDGPFIDLIRAIDDAYPEGRIRIDAYPVARAVANVVDGTADLAFPEMSLGPDSDAKLPYRFSTEPLGRVSFVLYSNTAKPLDRAQILAAAERGQPYDIVAPPMDWGFPTLQFINFDSTFKRIGAGRIDGLLWAQEEADKVLRELGLKNIRRAHFHDYDDIFILPRSPRGDFVDGILSRVIKAMRANGTLAAAYGKVHRPYVAWQP
jgi:polar amino acid transport system substrate-binding protein